MLARFLARQLARPTSILGPLVLAPLWNRRNAALNDAAFGALRLGSEDRVLDVGFGGGYLLRQMTRIVTNGLLAGVDISPAMVAYCARRERTLVEEGRLVLKCAAVEALPFSDGLFTKASSVNSIFYWEDMTRALAELSRVLAPDATLVLCFTDKGSLQRKSFAQHGLALHEVEDLKRSLEMAGFRMERAMQASDKHRQFWCLVARR